MGHLQKENIDRMYENDLTLLSSCFYLFTFFFSLFYVLYIRMELGNARHLHSHFILNVFFAIDQASRPVILSIAGR